MKIILALLSTLFCFSLLAQETSTVNDPAATARTLNASFSSISISDGISVWLSQGNEESVAVSYSDEKFADRFKTEVVDGVLKIYYDNSGLKYATNKHKQLKAYVSFKTLEKLTGSGGANVKFTGKPRFERLQMKFTSGSKLEGSIDANEIAAEQGSGSTMKLAGKSGKFDIEVSSGAVFSGYDFSTSYCSAKASSGGEVKITVDKELSATASSGGGIRYSGNGMIKDISVNSGGVVKKK